MQNNKYLDELGIPKEKYGTNFISNHDHRNAHWKEERKSCGFDNRETWNLDHIFVEWLYSHLMMFNEQNVIDTTFHKFNWQGKEITQCDAIDLLINASREYLIAQADDTISEVDKVNKFNTFCDLMPLWGMILPCMWW